MRASEVYQALRSWQAAHSDVLCKGLVCRSLVALVMSSLERLPVVLSSHSSAVAMIKPELSSDP